MVPKIKKSGISNKEAKISEKKFKLRFGNQFLDPYFDKHRGEIDKLADVAWQVYQESRKAPFTRKAGPEFKDPNYDLSVEWYDTCEAMKVAQKIHDDPLSPPQILIISASDRNEHTCPGEQSKTILMTELAAKDLRESGAKVQILDLSTLTSEYGKNIYPCKACVSTAMPLCHWPCSCYPNHSLNQNNDWMNEIYPMWVQAHGIMIITPVYWHQAPSALKLMIDRLVCADGGNTDPTTTQGKNAELAKKIEMKGWDYPRHLEGRLYSVVVHGDALGADDLKNSLTSWLDEMMLISSGTYGKVARYIGYYETYAESHEAYEKDQNIQKEVILAARALALNVTAQRQNKLQSQIPHLDDPRPK